VDELRTLPFKGYTVKYRNVERVTNPVAKVARQARPSKFKKKNEEQQNDKSNR
jgi:hypothetical protein